MLNPLRSLRGRFVLLVVAVYALVFALGFAVLVWQSLRTGGESHHAGPAIALEFALDEVEFRHGTARFAGGGAFDALARRNPQLWLLTRSNGEEASFGPVPAGARAFFARASGTLDTGRFHVPGVARPLSDAIADEQNGQLILAGGVDPETITWRDAWRYLALQGVLVVALGVGGVGLLATFAALPLLSAALRPLTREVTAIRAETPSQRLRADEVPSELLPLVNAFNAALDRLEGELKRRRGFIRDVAHELRTPLAILSLQADQLDDGERKLEFRRVVARMSHMVAQMLDVERLAMQAVPATAVDLVSLARDVVSEMAPLAIESGYELSLSAPEGTVEASGDALALERALTNLVANAVAHGGGSGAIEVVVSAEREIDVIDAGLGIPSTLRATVFEPFTRERWDRDGCGLGLHLTRQILRTHGGDAILIPSVSGAHFRLWLPKRQ
jgi:signal transduction histidine kinase